MKCARPAAGSHARVTPVITCDRHHHSAGRLGYGVTVRSPSCDSSKTEQHRRNHERAPAAVVPAAVVESMLHRWTVPTADEAHRVTDLVDGADDPAWPAWPPPI